MSSEFAFEDAHDLLFQRTYYLATEGRRILAARIKSLGVDYAVVDVYSEEKGWHNKEGVVRLEDLHSSIKAAVTHVDKEIEDDAKVAGQVSRIFQVEEDKW